MILITNFHILAATFMSGFLLGVLAMAHVAGLL
jgi:hypothetical protein